MRFTHQLANHLSSQWHTHRKTLEALFRKLKSLETSNVGKLGGRICSVIEIETRYPIQTWFEEHRIATNLVAYLSPAENQDLGIVKAPCRGQKQPQGDLSPSPHSQVLTFASSV